MALWSRKDKGRQRDARGRFRAPDQWQQMLEQLQNQHEKHERTAKGKKHLRERRHVDDFREFRLDGTKTEGFSEALLDLTADSYAKRDPLMGERRHVVDGHPGASKGFDSDEDARNAAQRAAAKQRRVMRQKGLRDEEHYYRAGERQETGEIDRTYQVGGDKRHRGPQAGLDGRGRRRGDQGAGGRGH